MTSSQDVITALDLFEPDRELGAGTSVRAAIDWSDERILVLTADNLLVWDGTLRPSPMTEVVAAADIVAMAALGEDLFMTGPNGLSVWSDGWLSELVIDGHTVTGPLATGAWPGQREVVWVATDSGVLAFTSDGGNVTAVANHPLGAPADSLAVDADGSLWIAAGGRVHRRTADSLWTEFDFPGQALTVAGSRASTRVWVGTDTGVFSGVGDEWSPVEGLEPDSTHWHVDDIGRLVALQGMSLTRVAIDRPLALRGIPDDNLLFGTSDLYIAPTANDQVESVTATLGGVTLAIEPVDNIWRAIMEPADLAAGSYDLTIEVAYAGASTSAQHNLYVSNPTWEKDIQPLFQERCSACHGGTTGTVSLNTPEAWEENFAEIVDRTTRNNMPLGLEPLSDLQKGMIQAWGAKGFPR